MGSALVHQLRFDNVLGPWVIFSESFLARREDGLAPAWAQGQRMARTRVCFIDRVGGRGGAPAFQSVVDTAAISVGRHRLADSWRERDFAESGR